MGSHCFVHYIKFSLSRQENALINAAKKVQTRAVPVNKREENEQDTNPIFPQRHAFYKILE